LKKKVIIIILCLCILWSAMAITDYIRAKNLKEPIFTVSTARDQMGNGVYKCIGYKVESVAGRFNSDEYTVYDMRYSIFGKTLNAKDTMYDNFRHNHGLLGVDKKTVLMHFEALKAVQPDVSGNQEIYTEYIRGDDVTAMNMILYNGIVAGFEYEYDNLQSAYNFASYLRKDLELTYGEKVTYPGMIQTEKDYFDNIKSLSDIKPMCKYYEDWTPGIDGNKKENINKMLGGKSYSRMDIRMELNAISENKATVTVRYIALP